MASIRSELETLKLLGGEFKHSQFIKETKATQAESEEYLNEFYGNVPNAVAAYK